MVSQLRSHGSGPSGDRRLRGQVSCLAGQLAEDSVADLYERGGCSLMETRWRGPAGEIDLIFRDGDELIFVEVKKSSSHALAASRLDRRQMDRICLSALDYADRIGSGRAVPMRFDAALVDGHGRVDIIRNAFGMN